MTNTAPITLAQLWRFKAPRGTAPHQDAAIAELEEALRSGRPYQEVMRRSEPWFATWSQDGKQPEPAAPQSAGTIRLAVPYFSQLDNRSGTGWRECFSSSCAMVAAFWGKVASDDDYNAIRARYGDSTSADAQIAALRELGLSARLVTNCGESWLEQQLREGRPVPVGWLHNGPLARPTGGGHWTVVIGCTPDAWIHNDPNGEAKIMGGGYANHTGGAGITYSRQNWGRRWEADGLRTGWALDVRPMG